MEVSEEWVTGRYYLDMLSPLLVELGLLALALDFGRGQLLSFLHTCTIKYLLRFRLAALFALLLATPTRRPDRRQRARRSAILAGRG